MKRIFTLTIMAAALLAAGLHAQTDYYAPESRWVLGGNDAKDNPFYLDSQTLRYRPADPDYCMVWVKFTQKDGGYMLMHYEFHRTNGGGREHYLSGAGYSAAGEMTQSTNSPGAWEEVIPGSVGEGILRRIFSAGRGSHL
jgi:hypothetical protein